MNVTCAWCKTEQPPIPAFAAGVSIDLPPRGWLVVARDEKRITYCSEECRDSGEAFVG